MAQHSAIIGGSNAGRLVNCPGSHQAILALPPDLTDLPSEYAAEGSAMHAVMARLMQMRRDNSAGRLQDRAREARGWQLGRIGDPVLTRDHLDTMIVPALDHLDELEEIYSDGGPFRVVGVELRVKFPRIPGAFGTCDLILRNEKYTLLVDWKFGSGVGVQAVYNDPDSASSYVNPQLLYYQAGALRSKPRLFSGKKFIVAIIQPRGLEPLTFTEVTRQEVRMFVEDAENAVLTAIGRDPPRVRGEWCRFAPCKSACPLWTGPLLELAQLAQRERASTPVPPGMHRFVDANGPEPDAPDAYGNYLAKAKALVDSLVLMKTTIDEQMHTFLEQGGTIPGWRLKHKTKMRQWVDPDVVAKALSKLGFSNEQIFQRKLVTFQSADATARRLGVEIPEELRVAPAPTETTLARTDDPAPVVEPKKLIDQFRASLQLLQQQGARPQPAAARPKNGD